MICLLLGNVRRGLSLNNLAARRSSNPRDATHPYMRLREPFLSKTIPKGELAALTSNVLRAPYTCAMSAAFLTLLSKVGRAWSCTGLIVTTDSFVKATAYYSPPVTSSPSLMTLSLPFGKTFSSHGVCLPLRCPSRTAQPRLPLKIYPRRPALMPRPAVTLTRSGMEVHHALPSL